MTTFTPNKIDALTSNLSPSSQRPCSPENWQRIRYAADGLAEILAHTEPDSVTGGEAFLIAKRIGDAISIMNTID